MNTSNHKMTETCDARAFCQTSVFVHGARIFGLRGKETEMVKEKIPSSRYLAYPAAVSVLSVVRCSVWVALVEGPGQLALATVRSARGRHRQRTGRHPHRYPYLPCYGGDRLLLSFEAAGVSHPPCRTPIHYPFPRPKAVDARLPHFRR